MKNTPRFKKGQTVYLVHTHWSEKGTVKLMKIISYVVDGCGLKKVTFLNDQGNLYKSFDPELNLIWNSNPVVYAINSTEKEAIESANQYIKWMAQKNRIYELIDKE